MCINQAQYAKVIDKGIDAPMYGLFLPGSQYYTTTAYPKYDPTRRPSWSSRSQQQTGSRSRSPSTATSNPDVAAGGPVPPAGLPAGRA